MIVSNIHNVVMKKGEDDREKKPRKTSKAKNIPRESMYNS